MTMTPAALTIDRRTALGWFVLVWTTLMTGLVWNARANMSPNDNARWNTAWSLVEWGTYEIFDTKEAAEKAKKPLQLGTIDKVMIDGRTYASKPPLLPTLIAGWWFVIRPIVGPVDTDGSEPVDREDGTIKGSFQIYSKTTIFVFQILPYALVLWLFGRFLEEENIDGPGWLFSMLFAGFGTPAAGYLATLNNHTIGFCFVACTVWLLRRIAWQGRHEAWRFVAIGLCAGMSAACEIPAALLTLYALALVLVAAPSRTLTLMVPALAVVTAAVFATNWLATGDLKPAYMRKELYQYVGSYWVDPKSMSRIDALNFHPEPHWLYFLHLTVGHHGLFSLTPVWLLTGWLGLGRLAALFSPTASERPAAPSTTVGAPSTRASAPADTVLVACTDPAFAVGRIGPVIGDLALAALAMSLINFGYFQFLNDQRNYGGFCHGPRWLMWPGGLWLFLVPAAWRIAARSAFGRRLAGAALVISMLSTADTWYNPWTRSWLHRIFVWFGIVNY
jgi:hypothetical protein